MTMAEIKVPIQINLPDDWVEQIVERLRNDPELEEPEPCEDVVSRQAAIDEWKNDFKGYVNALNIPRDDYNGIMEYIDELPSAQPEIIRCKDCKYMTEHYDTDGNVPYWTCSEWDSGTDYDGFCHYAERREE